MMRKLAVAVIILALIFPTTAFAGEEAMVADLVVRPLGFVGFTLGSAVYLVTLPFSIVIGGSDKMAETFVKKPYRFTFQRDMGEGLEPFDDDLEW